MPGSGHCCRLRAEPFAVALGIGARLARIDVSDHAEHTLPTIRQSGDGTPEQETIMTGPFGATSTTDDVLDIVDLRGKRILVTGVSAGLGVETARALAAHGAQVVGAARDLDKARAATDQVRAQAAPGGGLELVRLDLASLASVRACADTLLADGRAFDLVIANAGVMACPKSVTQDGFETQFGTNHLGHFLLVNRIASLFKQGSRLVNLSSSGHRFADVDLEDPNFEHTPYQEFVAYGRSKTATSLFAVEFDRRHRDEGVRATAVHPGGIQAELARHMAPEAMQQMIEQINANNNAAADEPHYALKSIPQGAATSVWAGVVARAEDVGGRYCEDCHVAEIVEGGAEFNLRSGVRAYALDPGRAKALWAKSEAMVGEATA
jgi:NAD(P)-dependent dehydrogenase (short-subunit alcohol dehydrogenase family)